VIFHLLYIIPCYNPFIKSLATPPNNRGEVFLIADVRPQPLQRITQEKI
jgi:hypothetical protein